MIMTVTSLTVTSMENAVLLSIFFNRKGLKVKKGRKCVCTCHSMITKNITFTFD